MAVLFVGSAPSELGGGLSEYVGTSAARDPAFTPVASTFSVALRSAGFPFSIPATGSVGDTWFHYVVHFGDTSLSLETNSDGYYFTAYDDADATVMRYRIISGVFKWEVSGQTSVNAAQFAKDQVYTIDLRFLRDGVNYTFELYISGVLQFTKTWPSTKGPVRRVSFDHFDLSTSGAATRFIYSEFIVTEGESPIGWRLASLEAIAQGFHTEWTGDFTGIQEFGDGLGISAGTVGHKESWTVTYAGPASPSIRAVVGLVAAATTEGSGPQGIRQIARISGVDYAGAALIADGTRELTEFAVNPATGLAWTDTDLTGLELGVEALA